MKKWTVILCILSLTAGLLAGCGGTGTGRMENGSTEGSSADGDEETDSGTVAEGDFYQTDADMFTDRDYRTDYDEDESVSIQLNGDSASSSSDSVVISGTNITITEEATYIISGTLDDGMIIVDAPDTAKLQIVLDGADITSGTSAPLYILEADKVFVTLAEGTENTLSNGGTFTAVDENNIDSVIFSKQDLTLNGSGSLNVVSPAGHGIVSKDDLVITGGNYIVSAASHGFDANDSIRITGETEITVTAGKDGFHAENSDDESLGFVYISGGTMDIEAEGDGISAGAWMQIEAGTFDILAGGGSENGSSASSDSWGEFRGGPGGMGNPGRGGNMGNGSSADSGGNTGMMAAASSMESTEAAEEADSESTSMKGLKAGTGMLISDGTFTIDSADDSVHSNASITVNGGNFGIESGDDAFHADETLTVTAGTINVAESYEGLEALYVDIQGGDITLTASDDGLNAAGGTDSSGTEGGRDGMFGDAGRQGGGGAPDSSSSDGTIAISGGNLYINASGDGIDANGTLEISGGYTVVTGPTQGDTATLDYDVSAVITGGTFIGTGASGMAQTFSSSEQGVISVSAGSQSAGTEITLADADGNTILTYTPELDFNVVILSSPDIVSGETYTITVGSDSGEFEAA